MAQSIHQYTNFIFLNGIFYFSNAMKHSSHAVLNAKLQSTRQHFCKYSCDTPVRVHEPQSALKSPQMTQRFDIHLLYCMILLALCLHLSAPHASAQQSRIADSLQRALLANPHDSIKVRLLNGLAWEYRGLQMLRALEYGKQALELATKLELRDEMINSHNYIGVVYRNMGNYTQSMSSYLRALEIAETDKNDKQIAYCYNNIGNLYMKQKQYKSALENCLKALAAFERLSDTRGTAYAHLRIGEVYEKQQQNEQAIEHYQESLRLRKEQGDKEGLITPLINIATVYRQMGNDSLAFDFYNQSLVLEHELNHHKGLAGSLVGLGHLYMKRGNFSEAIHSAEESLHHSRRAAAIQEEISALKLLTEAYSKKNDYAKAFQWQEAFLRLRDSLQNDETSSQMSSLRAEYEAEKREAEIVLLNKNKQMQTWLLIGSTLALIAFVALSVVLFRLNKQRRQANSDLLHQNSRIEEERQRSEALLLNILPAAIAERMKSGETTIAEYFDGATVLFADIVGFTKLASRLAPGELVGMLDAIFSDFDALADKYGLEKIKTIGDSYMVVSGVPQPRADHAQRVAFFALEAIDTMHRYNAIGAENAQPHSLLELRIGIHTGKVVAGVIGKKKFAYDLWGDTVNIASRMESHGASGQIHISDDVRLELIKAQQHLNQEHHNATTNAMILPFQCIERGEIEVKGKGMMKTYFLQRT